MKAYFVVVGIEVAVDDRQVPNAVRSLFSFVDELLGLQVRQEQRYVGALRRG